MKLTAVAGLLLATVSPNARAQELVLAARTRTVASQPANPERPAARPNDAHLRQQDPSKAPTRADDTVRIAPTLLILIEIYSGIGLLLLATATSVLLIRSQRRLAKANKSLEAAVASSQTLQEERTVLEQNLHQFERLDSIGLLAGGFAHDFNNILVCIRGNTQLLLAQDMLTASQREMLDEVLHASGRAAQLCKDILSYAHSEPTPKNVYDLRDVILDIVPLAKAGVGSSIDITMDLGETARLVNIDPTQIEQVLLNVLVNAGDAIANLGHIHISVDEHTLDGSPPTGYWFGKFTDEPGDYISVSVLDNGQGMTTETIQHIFDPFFSTRFAGRGLGLASAFGILRRHQGIVEVQSTIDEGTRFTIYLPRASTQSTDNQEPVVMLQPAPPPTNAPRLEQAPSTILVVDDEPCVCQVAREALAADGHTVLTATSAAEAQRLLEHHGHQIGLALLDVTMPDMHGPTLAQHLRRQLPDLPIVLMTGHAEAAVRSASPDMPLILKPFDLNVLRSTILEHLTVLA